MRSDPEDRLSACLNVERAMRIGLVCTRAGRRLGLDRNPLRRSSDRIEAGLLCGMIVAFGILAPLTAVKASHWVTAAGTREVRTEQTSQWAAAQTSGTATRLPPYKAAGVVSTAEGDLATATVSTGKNVTPAVTMAQVRSRAEVTLVFAPIVLAGVMALVFWVIRQLMDRRRMARWGRAWSVTGPQWSGRR
jgi:hypothetical protein